MEKKEKKRRGLIVIILLLLLIVISVGYAAFSTKLNINGTSGINKNTWNVHFENLKEVSGSAYATTKANLDETSTAISYAVSFELPGDYYEFTIDVVNEGSVPAKLATAPKLSGISEEQKGYVLYTITYEDGKAVEVNDKLKPGETKTFRVRVGYDKDVNNDELPSQSQTLKLGCALDYVQQ